MSKTLRITFSGICTIAPGIPRDGEETPETVYVMMPQARQPLQRPGSVWVVRHHAFLYVPDVLLGPVPDPAFLVRDTTLGLCNVYLVDHARIRVTPAPENDILFFTTNLPLGTRPGGPGSAPMEDCRWLPDARDVLAPGNDVLQSGLDPRRSSIPKDVSMIVELDGGTIRANVPCENVQPRNFVPPGNFPGPRVLASEFTVEMTFPDALETVKLSVAQLDPLVEVEGIPLGDVVLRLNASAPVDLRIGNDTLDEIAALRSGARCDVPDEPFSLDNDFDLHYNLLVPGLQRSLPQNGGGHSEHNGCVGYMVKLPVSGG